MERATCEARADLSHNDIGVRIETLLERLPAPERRELMARLRERYVASTKSPHERDDVPSEPLTRREREVLTLVAHGYTRAEIARSLSISVNTAAAHIASIYRKCGLGSIADATRWAIRRGVIEL